MSAGRRAFIPFTYADSGSGRSSAKETTWPRAWTPASVRPAAVTRRGVLWSVARARSTSACTDGPFGCTCQPT